MGIYDKLFVNHYNYYGHAFGPERLASVFFVSIMQVFQICIISAPFNFFGLLDGGKQGNYVAWILAVVVYVFNIVYYNGAKLDILLTQYNSLNDKKKIQSRCLSVSISILTLSGFMGIIIYNIYVHKK